MNPKIIDLLSQAVCELENSGSKIQTAIETLLLCKDNQPEGVGSDEAENTLEEMTASLNSILENIVCAKKGLNKFIKS